MVELGLAWAGLDLLGVDLGLARVDLRLAWIDVGDVGLTWTDLGLTWAQAQHTRIHTDIRTDIHTHTSDLTKQCLFPSSGWAPSHSAYAWPIWRRSFNSTATREVRGTGFLDFGFLALSSRYQGGRGCKHQPSDAHQNKYIHTYIYMCLLLIHLF